MTNNGVQAEGAVAAPRAGRIAKIVRWAARITSIPVFIQVVTALSPALMTFRISAKDDQLIALGLCCVCAGLVVGWKWGLLGGTTILGGVAVVLSQSDNLLYADPFSIAFGLQGILFLISGVLNSQLSQGSVLASRWFKPAAITLLILCATAGAAAIFRGPAPAPVPKDKESFIGVWQNASGLTLEISPEGHAKVTQETDLKVDPWNKPLAKGSIGAFQLYFRADEKLELTTGPFGEGKIYHIDRSPHNEGKQVKMVLNGSDPYRKTGGMILVKKTSS